MRYSTSKYATISFLIIIITLRPLTYPYQNAANNGFVLLMYYLIIYFL